MDLQWDDLSRERGSNSISSQIDNMIKIPETTRFLLFGQCIFQPRDLPSEASKWQ
jgi:hypothetical protein